MNKHTVGRTTRLVTALAALGSVVVHLYIAPEHLGEKFYIGVLFVLGSALLMYSAVQLLRKADRLAWRVGAIVSAGMIVGFLLSRTIGLPAGYRERSWDVPFGPLALLFEVAYLLPMLSPDVRRWAISTEPHHVGERRGTKQRRRPTGHKSTSPVPTAGPVVLRLQAGSVCSHGTSDIASPSWMRVIGRWVLIP